MGQGVSHPTIRSQGMLGTARGGLARLGRVQSLRLEAGCPPLVGRPVRPRLTTVLHMQSAPPAGALTHPSAPPWSPRTAGWGCRLLLPLVLVGSHQGAVPWVLLGTRSAAVQGAVSLVFLGTGSAAVARLGESSSRWPRGRSARTGGRHAAGWASRRTSPTGSCAAQALVGGGVGGLDQGESALAGDIDAVVLVHQQIIVRSPAAPVDPKLELLIYHDAHLRVVVGVSVPYASLLARQRWIDDVVDEPPAQPVGLLLQGQLLPQVVVGVQVPDRGRPGPHLAELGLEERHRRASLRRVVSRCRPAGQGFLQLLDPDCELG